MCSLGKCNAAPAQCLVVCLEVSLEFVGSWSRRVTFPGPPAHQWRIVCLAPAGVPTAFARMPARRQVELDERLGTEGWEAMQPWMHTPLLPLVYAGFMLVCGASILSGPSWVLMMAMSLFLLGACLRAAAMDAVDRAQILMADADVEEQQPAVDLPATPHNMFTLLRTARVVLLPRNYGHGRLADVEHGAAGAGHDTVLLTQIAQQLGRARSGGTQGPPWAQTILPISQEELDALPTCAYLPSTRLSASRFTQQARNIASAPGDPPAAVAAPAPAAGSKVPASKQETVPEESENWQQGPGPSKRRSGQSEGGSSDSSFACSICLEDVVSGEQVMTLPCLHQFHAECVRPWLQRKGKHAVCPMCKTPVFT